MNSEEFMQKVTICTFLSNAPRILLRIDHTLSHKKVLKLTRRNHIRYLSNHNGMKLEIYCNKKTEKHNKTKNSQICGLEQNATE